MKAAELGIDGVVKGLLPGVYLVDAFPICQLRLRLPELLAEADSEINALVAPGRSIQAACKEMGLRYVGLL